MVTTFNKKDMVSFGKYLLSDKRTELIKETYREGDSIPLGERLTEVYSQEISNWSVINEGLSFEYFTQIQEVPKEGGNVSNPNMEVMGNLGWDLCGVHEGTYIYKRRKVN